MARLYNNFEFIGNLNFTKEPFNKKRFDSGWEKHDISLIVNETKSNGVFVKVESGMHTAKENLVYSQKKGLFGEKASNIQVKWDDRLNKDVINMVADYRKTIVDLTDPETSKEDYFNVKREIRNIENNENATDDDKKKLQELYDKLPELLPNRKEFINNYDVVHFLKDNVDNLKGKKVRIKGNIEKSHYNGKFYTSYVPQSIELVSDELPNKLGARLDLFFTKGAVDDSEFEKDKLLTFDTYILSRDNQHKKDVFFPQTTVLNASKLDMDNPAHAGRVNFIKKVLDQKGKKVYHIPFEVKIFRGADKVEFTEKDLTPMQKEMVALGISTVESFAPKDGLLGESVEQIRLVKPVLEQFNEENDFREGVVESDFEVDDLEYVVAEQTVTKPPVEATDNSVIGEVEFSELDDLL